MYMRLQPTAYNNSEIVWTMRDFIQLNLPASILCVPMIQKFIISKDSTNE